jgi:hypothetical protein
LSKAQPYNAIITPPPNLEMIASKQACFLKRNKYFHINKNDTGFNKALSLSLSLSLSLDQ